MAWDPAPCQMGTTNPNHFHSTLWLRYPFRDLAAVAWACQLLNWRLSQIRDQLFVTEWAWDSRYLCLSASHLWWSEYFPVMSIRCTLSECSSGIESWTFLKLKWTYFCTEAESSVVHYFFGNVLTLQFYYETSHLVSVSLEQLLELRGTRLSSFHDVPNCESALLHE